MNRNGPELEQVETIHFKDRRGAASLRYRNRPEISVLCVNKNPIRYGFRAGQRAISYSVDIALNISSIRSLTFWQNLHPASLVWQDQTNTQIPKDLYVSFSTSGVSLLFFVFVFLFPVSREGYSPFHPYMVTLFQWPSVKQLIRHVRLKDLFESKKNICTGISRTEI